MNLIILITLMFIAANTAHITKNLHQQGDESLENIFSMLLKMFGAQSSNGSGYDVPTMFGNVEPTYPEGTQIQIEPPYPEGSESEGPEVQIEPLYPEEPYPEGPFPEGPFPEGPFPEGPFPEGPFPEGPQVQIEPRSPEEDFWRNFFIIPEPEEPQVQIEPLYPEEPYPEEPYPEEPYPEEPQVQIGPSDPEELQNLEQSQGQIESLSPQLQPIPINTPSKQQTNIEGNILPFIKQIDSDVNFADEGQQIARSEQPSEKQLPQHRITNNPAAMNVISDEQSSKISEQVTDNGINNSKEEKEEANVINSENVKTAMEQTKIFSIKPVAVKPIAVPPKSEQKVVPENKGVETA